MKELPANAVAYKRTPDFTAATIPAGLLRAHRTKAGVWGRIVVTAGVLRYRIHAAEGEPEEEHLLDAQHPGVVQPERPHEVAPVGEVSFHVEFLRAGEPAGAPDSVG